MFYEIIVKTTSNNTYTHKIYERDEAIDIFVAIGACSDVKEVNLIDGYTGEVYGVIEDNNLMYWCLGV